MEHAGRPKELQTGGTRGNGAKEILEVSSNGVVGMVARLAKMVIYRTSFKRIFCGFCRSDVFGMVMIVVVGLRTKSSFRSCLL